MGGTVRGQKLEKTEDRWACGASRRGRGENRTLGFGDNGLRGRKTEKPNAGFPSLLWREALER
ncbi:MAG: hypothetical protein LBD06_04420 [Candidatus Accumulibacter sp.]|nr:hypothetical protein [Accumulibacter sp.]